MCDAVEFKQYWVRQARNTQTKEFLETRYVWNVTVTWPSYWKISLYQYRQVRCFYMLLTSN
jgi:hypothetical protein